MHKILPLIVALALGLLAAAQTVTTAHTLRVGQIEGDVVEGVAIDADGSIFIAGMASEPWDTEAWPTHGEAIDAKNYRYGFVAKLDAQGKPQQVFQFAAGVARLTTVELAPDGVYVGGYAAPAYARTIDPLGINDITAKDGVPHFIPSEHYTDDRFNKANDGRGAPIVMRFDRDLNLRSAAALDGWQSVWHVPRPLREDRWQPVGLAVLDNGDVIVSHDGGYVLDPGPGKEATADHFYHVPDHLSRLAPDLQKRRWKKDIYTPRIDRERAGRILGRPWKHDTLGNTRTLRVRTDGTHVYLAGWSPTRTSGEPWWSPFLFKMDGDGEIVWRAYNPDPQSGGGERMNGLVADSAVRSVNVDPGGHVLFAGISDGGNSVLRHDPRDYNQGVDTLRGQAWGFRGRTLFWGTVGRLDGQDPALLAGDTILGRDPDTRRVRAGWPIDIAPLADGTAVVLGRQTGGFPFTGDAADTDPDCGFLSIYSARFQPQHTTALPGIKPMTLAVHGRTVVAVGQATDEGVDVVILNLSDDEEAEAPAGD